MQQARLDYEARLRFAVDVGGLRKIPLNSPMRWFAISLMTGCSLSAAAWGQENAAPAPTDDVQHLPAFTVAEPRAADFLLQTGPIARNTDSTTHGVSWLPTRYSGPTRMWLTQWPRKKNAPPDPLPIPISERNLWIDAAYRGHGLKSGDEIVRVAGKLVAEMQPGECVSLFLAAANDPEKKGVEVEVRAKGEKGERKVTVTKAPFNEVIVVTQNPNLPFTPLPLPLPIASAPEPRAAK